MIQFLERNGYQIFQFDKLSLVEKLNSIKYAKEIIAGAGSGILFRNFLATHNKVTIITSETYIWMDLSLFLRGTSWRNENLYIFESEQSLGSKIFHFARNHASFKVPLEQLSGRVKYEPELKQFTFADEAGGVQVDPWVKK